MFKIMKVLAILMLGTACISAYAQASDDATAKLLQQSVTSLMEKNQIPGVAVELYVDGKLYENYSGYADRENKTPVINKTIFELGSISKVMTSILFAQEVDWAKMSLTDPLTKYLKDLPESFNKVSLQNLATHTSGLPFNSPNKIDTTGQLKEYLNRSSVKTQINHANKAWEYSNVGIGLLGYALESSTERKYDDLYRRHILNPLGMVNGVSIPKNLTKYFAQGYDDEGSLAVHFEPTLFPAAGGVKASALDMQRFLRAAIGLPGTPPRVFYPMRLTQSMFVKLNDGYQGLGWRIHPLESGDISKLLNVSGRDATGPYQLEEVYERAYFNGDMLIDKTGTTQGFRAYIAVIPSKKSGIIILANKNVPDSAIVKTARQILFKVTRLS
jgi:beta-lactamase class C